MNLIESLVGLVGKEKKPLHVGEVMTVWKLLAAFENGHAVIMALLSHTADPELKRFMESFLKDFGEQWIKRLKRFLQEEAIPLPRPGTDKPKSDVADMPSGGKLTEFEIATLLAAKILSGTEAMHHGIRECLRYDLGALLLELESAAYRQAFVLREIMERRGWLDAPPPWHASKPAESYPG